MGRFTSNELFHDVANVHKLIIFDGQEFSTTTKCSLKILKFTNEYFVTEVTFGYFEASLRK